MNRCRPFTPVRWATASGGVLIAGKSGSGKSTTTLACLTSGLLYAGDDYVLADVAAEPYVHSLYSTAKLVPDNCDRFPQLRPLVSNPDKLDEQKALIYLREALSRQYCPRLSTSGHPSAACDRSPGYETGESRRAWMRSGPSPPPRFFT